MSPDYLQLLQDDAWAILSSDPGLFFVPVFRSRTPLQKDADGNPIVGQTLMIEDAIAEALGGLQFKNGKCGIVVIVMLPDAQPVSDNSVGPAMDYTLIFRVAENRLINEGSTGTGITSGRLATHIMQLFNRRPLGLGGTVFTAGDKTLSEVPALDDAKEHEVRMRVTFSLPLLPRVAKPSIVLDTGIATITCATPEAAIWVTANGDFPTPTTPGAWVYESPIDTTGIRDLRAAAHHTTLSPSDDVWEEIEA